MKTTKESIASTAIVTKIHEDEGIIEAYVSIFGIIDDSFMNDIIEPGAFKKTIKEQGPAGKDRIRVLNGHWTSKVVAKPLLIEEHTREQLPEEITKDFPDATGGLFTRNQFIPGVQESRELFELYKIGAMNEWSIGFNVIDSFFEDIETSQGLTQTVRHIREVRLWEFSTVAWGANPATTTVTVKENDDTKEPAEPVTPLTGLSDIYKYKIQLQEIRMRIPNL